MTDAETVLASSALFLIEDLNRSAEFQAVGISSQLSNSPPLVVTCKPAHNVDLGIDGLYYMIPKVVCDRPVYRMPGTRLAAPPGAVEVSGVRERLEREVCGTGMKKGSDADVCWQCRARHLPLLHGGRLLVHRQRAQHGDWPRVRQASTTAHPPLHTHCTPTAHPPRTHRCAPTAHPLRTHCPAGTAGRPSRASRAHRSSRRRASGA